MIEEPQPRWLAFLNGEIDLRSTCAKEFSNHALPERQARAHLAKRGIQGIRSVEPDVTLPVYNMKDPVVGGYTPEKVALRRAIGLAFDVDARDPAVLRATRIEAQSPLPPHTPGYDPKFKRVGDHDPAHAKALLDMFGYIDRDGDGWREQPDGKPLTILRRTYPDGLQAPSTGSGKRTLKAVGLKVKFQVSQWPET